jgi:hypothetical protein
MDFKIISSITKSIITAIEQSAVASVRSLKSHIFTVRVNNLHQTQTVKGTVTVGNQKNLEKEVKVVDRSINMLKASVDGIKMPTSIKVDNFPEPVKPLPYPEFPKEIRVSNTRDFKTIDVNNQPTEELTAIKDAVVSLQSVVQKQEMSPKITVKPADVNIPPFPKFPDIKIPEAPIPPSAEDIASEIKDSLISKSPTTYLPVRLTDGEEFYAALSQISSGGGGGKNFSYASGESDKALIDANRHLQVDVLTAPAVEIGDITVSIDKTGLATDTNQASEIALLTTIESNQQTDGLTDTQLRATAVPVSVATIPSHNVTNAGIFAVQSTNQANSGVDIGDVTINNAAGAAAVNIQDGGNVITVDGTVSTGLSQPLTDTQLRATAVPISVATIPSHAVTNAGTFPVQATLAAETTKVIGTVNVAAGQTIGITANSAVNVAQMNGVTVLMGAGNTGTGSQRVTIASDQAAVASKAAINTYVDGSIVTLGAKADAKSTATDTTAVTMMQVLKQISASVQAPPSQAVTGTFWQATQPVSGTVTANTGLTQPLTDTQLRATAVPVSGTFYQATQPVSGTVTANAGTNLNTSALALEATLQLLLAQSIKYYVHDTETTATYTYIGTLATDGKWIIKRYTIATKTFRYAKGTSAYATNWTNRATLTYDLITA